MSGWGGGYVTDITYSYGWYRQQSPVHMAISSIIGGARADIPTGDDPVMMLELGCGFGYGAMALAASNPTWSITAVDFNPAHIAGAREWAAEAGLRNITFVEADLSRWQDHPVLRGLPEMDFVTMHGLWSWVPPETQTGIVQLLAQKLRPGGLVHLSYNTLPGWQELMGAARVIREAGRRTTGRSDNQAREGVRVLKDLIAANAYFTTVSTRTQKLLQTLDNASSNYLAHEFMNANWQPCFVGDVAARLADAKLEWVAAANLVENFPDLMMTEQEREIFNRYSDPLMQELIKDMCLPRQLRHDIFVRGARRMSLSDRALALRDVNLTLVKRPEDLPGAVDMPAGRAELNKEFYQPIVQALASGPRSVRDLLELPDVVGRRDNPGELLAVLIGIDMVETTARPNTEPGPEAIRFNHVSARRMMRESPQRPVVAACAPTGSPILTPLMSLHVISLLRSGVSGVDNIAAALGVAPDQADEARTSVEHCLDRYLPLLKNAGVF